VNLIIRLRSTRNSRRIHEVMKLPPLSAFMLGLALGVLLTVLLTRLAGYEKCITTPFGDVVPVSQLHHIPVQ